MPLRLTRSRGRSPAAARACPQRRPFKPKSGPRSRPVRSRAWPIRPCFRFCDEKGGGRFQKSYYQHVENCALVACAPSFIECPFLFQGRQPGWHASRSPRTSTVRGAAAKAAALAVQGPVLGPFPTRSWRVRRPRPPGVPSCGRRRASSGPTRIRPRSRLDVHLERQSAPARG
jgi:hypothetical protein